ncbi:methionine ABC transporter ATP-binding protein [Prescottella equi]|jgi:D-methionine transport system ATP-binding protein|uniref:methionine ABC transporter ATP-binding protein n=1 Tax=Rhodococcus hoagii TaxID=43767 RepID=UPI000A107232|nr:methionine ABC transporter ATP-binding protein [Prescottella equi]MBM4484235.1 ATP-binding cassette domain-containing protein [Prescottella equi]NKS76663.1 ATP-binding cassette domain-containing protein [Prescottella equi]ORL96025.1 methionine ABC transporter ATP-binding protein [Prescottella equi]ORM16927.1 methionine ABC transporter ATP-binding protein [Prescottella equi]QDP09197.1 methionine ABC transporter ATP-binding protein [Prescottella equi]
MITVENLVKTFPAAGGAGEVTALRGVDLDIAEGEIFGIVGPSGAGKSTLLRCLNLLEQPTSGRIVLRGDDLSQLSGGGLRQARRRIGTVFQQFNLLHSRTVRANVEFPLELSGMDRKTRRARADELIELVGLGGKEKAYPSQLSGGQQQRVGIARALASNPDVLLCDEATSALDPDTTDQVLDLLVELNRSIGVTVVLITHELGVLRRICTSAARLDDGRIAETGRILDLVGTPGSALGAAIVPVGDDPSAGDDADSALVTTIGDEAHGPWLAQLVRKLDVDISVVGGRVEQVAGVTVGRLRLKFGSDAPRGDIEAFVEAQPGTTLSWGPESRIEGRIA